MTKFILLKTSADANLEVRNLQTSFTEWILSSVTVGTDYVSTVFKSSEQET